MICKNFEDNAYKHHHEGSEKTYQLLFYNRSEESCAASVTEDELALLMVEPTVTETMRFIGPSADVWEDEEFRNRVCDKALEFVRQRES